MIFSGINNLSLSYQTGLSFNIDVSLDNLNGNCNLGFTGQNNNLNFKLDQGRIFDPENRLIYFYSSGENINISGNISPTNYSYYINNDVFCLNGKKSSYTISGYYINTLNCNANSDVQILGTRPNYFLNLSPIFYITGSSNLTGTIQNLNNLNFKIYSGSVTVPTGFTIQNISNFVSNTGYFAINTYNFASGQVEDERLYEVQLNLFTNFGQITGIFTTTGSYSGYINVNLDVFNITDNLIRTGVQTGIGDFKDNNFLLDFDIISGSIRSAPTELDKYLHVKLEYFGGNTGDISYNIFATGYRNDTITGFLNGSGILSKTTSFVGTGYNQISGAIQTGLISGVVSGFFYATGATSINQNVKYSGYIGNYLIQRELSILITGTAEEGYINYYRYLYTGLYNDSFGITGNDIKTGDNFGFSVSATTGRTFIAGAPNHNVNTSTGCGAVYVFSGLGSGFNQIAKLTGDNALSYDYFGTKTKISNDGNTIYVGATGRTINTITGGAVYIFTGNSSINNWSQNRMLTGIACTGYESFGYSLDSNLGNTVLLVGSPYKNIGNANVYTNAGGAYIFTGNGTSFWSQWSGFITGRDITTGDNFGFSIKVSNDGEKFMIGAPRHTIGTTTGVGAVYIFTGNGVDYWSQSVKITGLNGMVNDAFGYSVSSNSDFTILTIGATGNSGALHIFTGNGTSSWVEKQVLNTKETSISSNDTFGYDVKSTSNGRIIIASAIRDSNAAGLVAGSVVVFTGDGLVWDRNAIIFGTNIPQTSRFMGMSIDYYNNNSSFIFGAPLYNVGTYTDAGIVESVDSVTLSGYLERIIATGNISSTNNYFATGNLTGFNYKKIFIESFNLITGIYSGSFPTGLVDFNANNFIQNDVYVRSGIVKSGFNNIYVQAKTKNYLDSNQLTGKLTISGYTLDNRKNSVSINYITGAM